SRTPSPASRLLQFRVDHKTTPCANPCRSWLASEEARKLDAIFKDAFAGKPAPTRPRRPQSNALRKPL
ncbi:hypothetical protein SOP85_29955, partial [Pseudomonas sp. YuFO20]|uniref:hypothetical protein n=1 Tax=Pseudomonas sp. YuFO20 TaxID=3095362 RepID=UPI002B2555D7